MGCGGGGEVHRDRRKEVTATHSKAKGVGEVSVAEGHMRTQNRVMKG